MLTLNEIKNKEIWEGFFDRQNFQPIFFQCWTWGELERLRGKKVYNLGIFQDDELIGVGLCVLVKAKRGTFLHIRGGPVCNWQNRQDAVEVSKLICDFAKQLHCDFVRISPNILKIDTEKSKWLLDHGFKYCQMHDVDAEVTWVLDLLQNEEDI